MTEKAEVYREVIERRTFRGSTLTFPVWRFRVPLTGLCGTASSWELAVKRVCESLKDHRLREYQEAINEMVHQVEAVTGVRYDYDRQEATA